MNELRRHKNQIRADFRARRTSLTLEKKQALDTKLCNRFLSLASYRFAEAVLVYAPLPGEIDIYPIIRDALKKGKTVAFPRCTDNESAMTYHIVEDLSLLKKGSYGIMEPPENAPVYDKALSFKSPTLCFVPALCYDRNGYRLGYGKGYYDRYLSRFGGVKMGLCYSDFVVDSLPRGRYDASVDFLITEKGVLIFNEL